MLMFLNCQDIIHNYRDSRRLDVNSQPLSVTPNSDAIRKARKFVGL